MPVNRLLRALQGGLLRHLHGSHLVGSLHLDLLDEGAQLLDLRCVLVRLSRVSSISHPRSVDLLAQVRNQRIIVPLDHVQRRNHGLNQQLRC